MSLQVGFPSFLPSFTLSLRPFSFFPFFNPPISNTLFVICHSCRQPPSKRFHPGDYLCVPHTPRTAALHHAVLASGPQTGLRLPKAVYPAASGGCLSARPPGTHWTSSLHSRLLRGQDPDASFGNAPHPPGENHATARPAVGVSPLRNGGRWMKTFTPLLSGAAKGKPRTLHTHLNSGSTLPHLLTPI